MGRFIYLSLIIGVFLLGVGVYGFCGSVNDIFFWFFLEEYDEIY